MVIKSRDYVFKMSIFKKLSIVLYIVHWCILRPAPGSSPQVK